MTLLATLRGKEGWPRSRRLPEKAIAATDSFRWVIRPEGDMFDGEIYPYGSALDGPNPELMRCGWAFVVLCPETGEVIASAMGTPPPLDNRHWWS